jgi:hypothetical protein
MRTTVVATVVAVRTSIFACAVVVSLGLIGVPAASAVTFDFSSHSGLLGNTQTYTVSGFTVTAAGFTSNTFSTSTATALFGKSGVGDENGLGLANDPSGQDEITGNNLIRIALPAGLTNITFRMNSTTSPEGWRVFGSNLATSGYASLLTGSDEGTYSLPLENFYYFIATGGGTNNVLLASLSATPTPLPPALLLLGTALAGLGVLGRRRKKAAAVQAI